VVLCAAELTADDIDGDDDVNVDRVFHNNGDCWKEWQNNNACDNSRSARIVVGCAKLTMV